MIIVCDHLQDEMDAEMTLDAGMVAVATGITTTRMGGIAGRNEESGADTVAGDYNQI